VDALTRDSEARPGAAHSSGGAGFLGGIIYTSTVEADTARMIRQQVTTELLEPSVSHLGVGNAPLRAALVMSQIVGVALARYVVGLEDLASATPDEMVSALAPTLQRYLVGDIA